MVNLCFFFFSNRGGSKIFNIHPDLLRHAMDANWAGTVNVMEGESYQQEGPQNGIEISG